MEFKKLKEELCEMLNVYLDNIAEVEEKENDYMDDNGETQIIDGYNAIAVLLQKGYREAMLRIYEELPEEYFENSEENEKGHCCCGHNSHEEGQCCCGHHEDDEGCCCGGDDEGCCCGGEGEGGCHCH